MLWCVVCVGIVPMWCCVVGVRLGCVGVSTYSVVVVLFEVCNYYGFVHGYGIGTTSDPDGRRVVPQGVRPWVGLSKGGLASTLAVVAH